MSEKCELKNEVQELLIIEHLVETALEVQEFSKKVELTCREHVSRILGEYPREEYLNDNEPDGDISIVANVLKNIKSDLECILNNVNKV